VTKTGRQDDDWQRAILHVILSEAKNLSRDETLRFDQGDKLTQYPVAIWPSKLQRMNGSTFMNHVLEMTSENSTGVIGLLNDVFRTSRGVTDQNMATDYPLVFAENNFRFCRLIELDGKVVSHAAIWPRELVVDGERYKVGVLVAVATDPDYRKRNLAATLVQSLMDSLHAEEYDFAVLWTGVPGFYEKLGWHAVSTGGELVTLSRETVLSSVQENKEYAISPFQPDRHLTGVMKLHDDEPLRFARSPDDAAGLLTIPKYSNWVAEKDGEVAAYVVHAHGVNRLGITEYGGEQSGVLHLIKHVMHGLPAGAELPWFLYPDQQDLRTWSQQQGFSTRPLESSKGRGTEMHYIINKARVTPELANRFFVWGVDQA